MESLVVKGAVIILLSLMISSTVLTPVAGDSVPKKFSGSPNYLSSSADGVVNASKTISHNITVDLWDDIIRIGITHFTNRSTLFPSISIRAELLNESGNSTLFLVERTITVNNKTYVRKVILNITVLEKRKDYTKVLIVKNTSNGISHLTLELKTLWSVKETGVNVNRSVNMTVVKVNGSTEVEQLHYIAEHPGYLMVLTQVLVPEGGSYSSSKLFAVYIPTKNVSLPAKTLDFVRFTELGKKVIPQPFYLCLGRQPLQTSEFSQDQWLSCGRPKMLSDIYSMMGEVTEKLEEIYKNGNDSMKALSKYYADGEDDFSYLSKVIKEKMADEPIYGEHMGALSVKDQPLLFREKHCLLCCSKWDPKLKKEADDYLWTVVGEGAACVLSVIALSFSIAMGDIPHAILEAPVLPLTCLFLFPNSIKEEAEKTKKACIGRWYNCHCHYINVRW